MSASASSPSSTTPHKEQNGFTDYYLQTRNCSTTKADTASDWHCDTEGAFNDASPGDRFVWARSLNEESLKSAVPPQLAPIAEASVLASFRTYRPFATSRCGTLQISATTTNDGNSARAPPSVKGVHSPHSTLNGLSISPLKVPSITASRFVDDDASTECARCDMSTPVHSQTNDAQPARPPTFGEGTVPNEPAAAAAVAAATAAAAANAARHHPKALTHIQPAGSGPGVCHFCQSRRTGQWRRGPAGQRTLCNACGINWTKKIRAEARRAACSLADAETRVCRVFEKVARVLGIKAIVVQSGGATEEGAGGRRNSAPGDGGDDDSDQRSGNGDDGDEEYERESAGSGGGGVVLERSSMLDGVVLVPGVACWNALVALAAAACPDSVTGLATPVASGKLPAAAQNASNPALAALAVAAAATPPANHTGGPAARHHAPHHPHLQPVGGSAQPRTPAPHSASHAATATLKRRASEPTGAPGLAMTSPPPRKQQRRGSSPRQATATLPPLSLSLSLAAAAAAAQCDVERTAADAAAAGLAALRGSGSRTAPWTSGSPAMPARRGGNGVMGQ
ncbi:hypothetical protein HK405_013441 [Cladochytrium tenue]|nr:hypothetical protein HK405_013441 [Cladochytrium tenue]